MEAAYDNLPQEVKEKIDDAYAVHDFAIFREALINQGKSEEEIEEFNKRFLNRPIPLYVLILIQVKNLFM